MAPTSKNEASENNTKTLFSPKNLLKCVVLAAEEDQINIEQ